MKACVALLVGLLAAPWAFAQSPGTGSLRGHVTDPQGGVVQGAEVSLTGPAARTVKSDSKGFYALDGLVPGSYILTGTKTGFEIYGNGAVAVAAGRVTDLDIQLAVAAIQESVTVKSEAPALSLDPENNAGAIMIKGDDLDALPDDPDEMSDALQALAGPSAGPNGGQVFIDGFTGGRMPPKSSIREIRINANPFSAEYDRLGFGRIEILTKPGTDQWRGDTTYRFNDDSLNSRNPFATNKPPYQRSEWGGSVSGPLVAKKASFFLDFEHRYVDDNQLINATVLDPADLAIVPLAESVVTPQHRTTVSPRIDWQMSPSQTLVARYTYTSSDQTDAGVGGYSLPSRGYDTTDRQHTLQLTETAVFGKVINETRLRYFNERLSKQGDDTVPTLQVQDAFTSGGAQVGPSFNEQKRWELQNVTSWTSGKHSLRAGARLRTVNEDDLARQGFGGTVVFSGGFGPKLDANNQLVVDANGNPVFVPVTSMERYRRTIILQGLGLSPAAIRALGGGATQLQIAGGNPEAKVTQWDVAPFIQDDWHATTDLLLSAGLRYENQDNISSHLNFAPRLGLAWSVGPKNAQGQARTVVRAGFGVFYDRVGEDLTLRANHFDGLTTSQYVVSDPQVLDQMGFDASGGVSGVPSVEELAAFAVPQATWHLAPDIQAPYTMQSSLSLERQLPGNMTISGTFIAAQGRRQLRARNINAPMADGLRPMGDAAGDVFQVESTGRLNQYQGILGVNNRLSKKLTFFFRYFLSWAKSDTDGSSSFPANQYDVTGEYARAGNDVRHRVILGGNVTAPWGVRVSPFVILSTGRPYNITIGRDLNRDSLFTDRPAYATDPNQPGVVQTPYGLLDPDPVPGEEIVPRNLGVGPGFAVINLRLSKTLTFGKSLAAPAPPGGGGPGFGGPFGGGGRGRGDEGGGGRGLTISVSAQNLLNHVNPSTPVGNLTSLLFGQSLSTAGGFGSGGGSGGNRRIELQARLAF
ncbi:MAG: TonB-dependent receptor domain-containing protein [Vicinamibacteria bacterium]